MKMEYVRPEYENSNQLADIILLSVQEDPVENKIAAELDIEELFGV